MGLLWSSFSSAHAFGHLQNISVSYNLISNLIQNHEIIYCVRDSEALDQKLIEKAFLRFIEAIEQDVHVRESVNADSGLTRMKNVKIQIKHDCASEEKHVVYFDGFDEEDLVARVKKIVNNWDEMTSYYSQGKDLGFGLRKDTKVQIYEDHKDNFRVYLHEIGHAFGLCDQYSPKEGREKGYKNCDVSAMTGHRFEDALMYYGEDLHVDDIEGIIALFDRVNKISRQGVFETRYNKDSTLPFQKLRRQYNKGRLVSNYDAIYKDPEQTYVMYIDRSKNTENKGHYATFEPVMILYPRASNYFHFEEGKTTIETHPYGKNKGAILYTFDSDLHLESMDGEIWIDPNQSEDYLDIRKNVVSLETQFYMKGFSSYLTRISKILDGVPPGMGWDIGMHKFEISYKYSLGFFKYLNTEIQDSTFFNPYLEDWKKEDSNFQLSQIPIKGEQLPNSRYPGMLKISNIDFSLFE
ncbi:MAG: hypothetical protein KDD52_07020 [Bdellovibrionales bacterium]|nr:hypothetical protein [Bdellovibrionales bacterium]